MILKAILNILIMIISTLFQMISSVLPDMDFVRYYKVFFDIISNVMQSSVNFLYFMIGEAMFPLLTIANFLLVYRYLIFPIVVIVRRIFIKGGDT